MWWLRFGNPVDFEVLAGNSLDPSRIRNALTPTESEDGLSIFLVDSEEKARELGFVFSVVHRKKGAANLFGFLIPTELTQSLALNPVATLYEEDPPALQQAHHEIPKKDLTEEVLDKFAITIASHNPKQLRWSKEEIRQRAPEIVADPHIRALLKTQGTSRWLKILKKDGWKDPDEPL